MAIGEMKIQAEIATRALYLRSIVKDFSLVSRKKPQVKKEKQNQTQQRKIICVEMVQQKRRSFGRDATLH
jgi:hypothetical protein